jgi:anti-sigma-K factor RskA
MPDEPMNSESDLDMDEKLDPRLAARLEGLPRELAPSRDLWPGIASRLGPVTAAKEPPRLPAAVYATRPFWRQAAAAVLSAAIGAGFMWLALGGGRPAAEPGIAGTQSAGAVPVSYTEAPAGDDYRLIEADYLRAKEALWVSVYARRDRFSPATLEAVEKNFAIIDQAIFDLRQALAEDPGNRRLEGELYRNHRRGLDLLRRLADST